MSYFGHSVTLEKLNEFLNLRNKGIVTADDFATVCEQTKYVMVSRCCAFDTFGCKNYRSLRPTIERDIVKLTTLFERADLFPRVCTDKRVFHPDFWWNMVQRPTNVGSKKDKDKEKGDETKAVEMLCRGVERERNRRQGWR